MKTEIKQGVSKFTEKDLTPNSAHSFTEGSDIGPLETHVQSELEKIQAGHEAFVHVPAELWHDVMRLTSIVIDYCEYPHAYKGTTILRKAASLVAQKSKSL